MSDTSFVSFHIFFLFTLLKQISYVVLVDIFCGLVGKLWFKSPLSTIILMNFISISGTDYTYLSMDTSPSEPGIFSWISSWARGTALIELYWEPWCISLLLYIPVIIIGWKQVCCCPRKWWWLHLWCIPQHISRP